MDRWGVERVVPPHVSLLLSVDLSLTDRHILRDSISPPLPPSFMSPRPHAPILPCSHDPFHSALFANLFIS